METTSDRPIPARFWWLKRVGVAAAVVLAGVVIAHLSLGRRAANRLAAERLAWVAAGHVDPANPVAELPPPTGEDNPAVWIVRAAEALPELTDTQSADWDFSPQTFPPTGAARSALQSIVRQDDAALALLRRGRRLGSPDWGDWSITVMTGLPVLNDSWKLSDHLSWAAMDAILVKDVAAALGFVTDATWNAAAVADYGPSNISSRVSCSLQKAATDCLSDLLNEETSPNAWRAARPQVLELIDLLLDSDFDRRLRINGFTGDWYMTFNSGDLAAGLGAGDRNVLTAPFFDAQVADQLARGRAGAEAAERAETFAAFRPLLVILSRPAPQSVARASAEKMRWTMTPNLGVDAALIFSTIAAPPHGRRLARGAAVRERTRGPAAGDTGCLGAGLPAVHPD